MSFSKLPPFWRYVAVFVFGVLAALPVVCRPLSLLCFFLIIPFCLFWLWRRDTSPKHGAYRIGLLFFDGYFTTSFCFFVVMYPLDFVGLDTAASLAVVFAALVLLPLLQAAFFALSILLLSLFDRLVDFRCPFAFSFCFAALWTLFSFFQNFTWMGVPFAPLSLALTPFPALLGSASFFGHYVLIFVIVLVNSLLAEGIRYFLRMQKSLARTAALLAVGVLLLNTVPGLLTSWLPKAEQQTLRVAVIQGDTSSMDDYQISAWDILYAAEQMAYEAAKEQPEVMLWAEAVSLSAMSPELQRYFGNVAQKTNSIQIIGAYSYRDEKLYNSLFLFYPDGSMSEEIYDKRHPVPFGEYLPWESFFARICPPLSEMSMLSPGLTPGDGANLFTLPKGKAGGLICFDSIYPALARESAKEGADILFLSTNDSWFDGSFAKDMHFSHAVLRAVENGKYVVRTGNTGISGFICPDGHVAATAPRDTKTALILDVRYQSGMTLYTRLGDLFVYILPLALLSFPFIHRLYIHRQNMERKVST